MSFIQINKRGKIFQLFVINEWRQRAARVLMKEAKMPKLCFYRIALTIQLNRNEGLCNNAGLTPLWQPWGPGEYWERWCLYLEIFICSELADKYSSPAASLGSGDFLSTLALDNNTSLVGRMGCFVSCCLFSQFSQINFFRSCVFLQLGVAKSGRHNNVKHMGNLITK